MDKNKISTKSLETALESLNRALLQPKNEFNRDSVIQRFEYTFELSWKLLGKLLSADRPLEDRSVRGILREGAKLGLLDDLSLWFEFQEARNLTSHSYNEDTAEEVYAKALLFPAQVSALIQKIKKHMQVK
jgi:nucleotidyltransferase substrate binding protein (TIGR01987 family)